MPEPPSTRHTVFISYSHADRRYLDELLLHFEPLRREGRVRVWADTMLNAGDNWREEIASALASARVAILLVSAAFQASRFIAENELPPLLAATRKEGLLILPVVVGACDFHDSGLAGVQAVNDPKRPLNLMTKARRDVEWVKVARCVREVFHVSQSQTPMAGLAPVENIDDLIRLGTELRKMRRYTEALHMYERALELDPDKTAAWEGKGNALEALGRYDEMADAYERALEYYEVWLALFPDDTTVWGRKAIVLVSLNRDSEADEAFEQLLAASERELAIDPTNAQVWRSKGATLQFLGRSRKALAAYDRAVTLDDTQAWVWRNKAALLSELGRQAEADAAEQRARELG